MTTSPTSFQPLTVNASVAVTFSPEEAAATPDFSVAYTILTDGLDAVAQSVADALVDEGSTATIEKHLSINHTATNDVTP